MVHFYCTNDVHYTGIKTMNFIVPVHFSRFFPFHYYSLEILDNTMNYKSMLSIINKKNISCFWSTNSCVWTAVLYHLWMTGVTGYSILILFSVCFPIMFYVPKKDLNWNLFDIVNYNLYRHLVSIPFI